MAERLLANKNVLGSSASHSSLSPENRELKTATDLLMNLKRAGILIPHLIQGFKVFPSYHPSNLPKDALKMYKYKLNYILNLFPAKFWIKIISFISQSSIVFDLYVIAFPEFSGLCILHTAKEN